MSSKSNKAVEVLELVASELTYLPTPEQRRSKSAFWACFNDNPICEPEDISLAIALRFVADSRLSNWWPQTGFKEWFRNRDEFRQRMEYLAALALDSLEFVLVDPKSQASAKVNAAKLIMEVTRRMPSRSSQDKYLDEKIHQMDRKQLEEFLQRNIKLLKAPNSLDSSDDSLVE